MDVLVGVDLADAATKRLSGGDTEGNLSTGRTLESTGLDYSLLKDGYGAPSATDIHSFVQSLLSEPPSAAREQALQEATEAAWAERRLSTWQVRLLDMLVNPALD